jgi:hypothetical protein
MMQMKNFRAAKHLVPSAAGLTPALFRARGAARNLHFLSCAADVSIPARLASTRTKRSEQTIYHAATREVLQIDLR